MEIQGKPRVNISELLAPVPLFRKVRTHKTELGEILCTGKGCVACFPDKYGYEVSRSLGDIDTVDFRGDTSGSSLRVSFATPLEISDNSCHGNGKSDKTVESGDFKMSKRNASKRQRKHSTSSGSSKVSSLKGSSSKASQRVHANQQNGLTPRHKVKEKLIKKDDDSKNVRARARIRGCMSSSNTLLLPSVVKTNALREKKPCHKSPTTSRVVTREQGIQTSDYDVTKRFRELQFQDRSHKRRIRTTQTLLKTGFLEMLINSKSGIYDSTLIATKKSSPWVQKMINTGVSESEILPPLPPKKEVNHKKKEKIKTKKTKPDQSTPNIVSEQVAKTPKIELESTILLQGEAEDSVIVVEHDHESSRLEDANLYRLCFALQQFNSIRDFPKVDVLEIAEALSDLVQLGAIKVIQRRGRKWFILVRGDNVKELLLQSGIVLRGRQFQLVDNGAPEGY